MRKRARKMRRCHLTRLKDDLQCSSASAWPSACRSASQATETWWWHTDTTVANSSIFIRPFRRSLHFSLTWNRSLYSKVESNQQHLQVNEWIMKAICFISFHSHKCSKVSAKKETHKKLANCWRRWLRTHIHSLANGSAVDHLWMDWIGMASIHSQLTRPVRIGIRI